MLWFNDNSSSTFRAGLLRRKGVCLLVLVIYRRNQWRFFAVCNQMASFGLIAERNKGIIKCWKFSTVLKKLSWVMLSLSTNAEIRDMYVLFLELLRKKEKKRGCWKRQACLCKVRDWICAHLKVSLVKFRPAYVVSLETPKTSNEIHQSPSPDFCPCLDYTKARS